MKKIEFGYSNEFNPTGGFDGMGIKPGLLLTEADYYGSVGFEGNNYIVAKVVKDDYNRYPQLLDKFIVRQALCDLYADGSANLMLNQEETQITRMLEEHLNLPQIKDRITSIDDVKNLTNNLHNSSRAFILGELGLNGRISSVSITPEAFEIKNNAINSCRKTISDMQQELTLSYTK